MSQGQHEYADGSIGIELLEQLVVSMAGFEFVKRRNDLPHGVKAMPKPGLLDSFGKKVEPDAEASGECLRLIAGVGIDGVVVGQQLPEDEDNDQRRAYD